jgi:hypothetical protein
MANNKEETIEVMVAKRKSVDVDGVLHGPGAKLTLPLSEAKALYEKGFIAEPDDDAVDAGVGPSIQIDGQGA